VPEGGSVQARKWLSLSARRAGSMVCTDWRHAADAASAAMLLSIQLSHYGVGWHEPRCRSCRPADPMHDRDVLVGPAALVNQAALMGVS
jgi:hypothetical protein